MTKRTILIGVLLDNIGGNMPMDQRVLTIPYQGRHADPPSHMPDNAHIMGDESGDPGSAPEWTRPERKQARHIQL